MHSDDLLLLKIWGQAVAGPDGRVYFVESSIDREKNQAVHRIMQAEHTDNAAAWAPVQPFTGGSSDVSPKISPDGQWLGFLSKRSGVRQVWVMATAGGEAEQVTWFKGGVSEFTWDPSSRKIAVVASMFHGLVEYEGVHAEVRAPARYRATRDVMVITDQYYKHDGLGYLDKAIHRIILVDLDSSFFEVLTPGLYSASHIAFSGDGLSIYYLQRPHLTADSDPGIKDVFRYRLDTKEMMRVTDLSLHVTRIAPAGGDRIVLTAADPMDYGYGNEELYLFEEASKQLRSLSAGLDRPAGDHTLTDTAGLAQDDPLVMPGGDTVVMSVSREGSVNLWEFGWDGRAPRMLTQGEKTVYSYARHPAGIVALWADDRCPSVMAVVTGSPGVEPALRVEMPWPASEIAEPRPLHAVSADGTEIPAWILLPDDLNAPVPAVLEIHGGPMALYGHRFFFEMQWLRSRGYAVVYGNPRGSAGYGRDFCRSIMGHWGDKDYEDVTAIMDAALASPYSAVIDRDRLGIMGGSYGGFMVNWAISHTSRFRCAVTMRSVVNRLSAMGTSDLGWLRVPQYGTGPWWEEPEPYWQQSPLQYASNIATPLLIEHQLNDFRLPVEQAEQLYRALKYLGREVKLVLYPDESHGMSRGGRPWHRVFRLDQIAGWLDQHLNS